MNLSKTNLAIISLCFVAFCYSLLTVVARFMSTGEQPFTQVYIRIGLAVVLGLVLFRKDINFKRLLRLPKKDWLLLTIMGTAGYGLAVDFVTLGSLHTKLLNVAVISSTVPFFVFLY